ncbi:hypothetical protein EDC01DRAFT_776020 [Geopyxis carbonaria]|nr:hypothetical protein EDC01DRAFT_776020 [Geopyxis carbonaria]
MNAHDCAICLYSLDPQWAVYFTNCGHTFDGKCLNAWRKSLWTDSRAPLSCPTCRGGGKIKAHGKKAKFLFYVLDEIWNGVAEMRGGFTFEQELGGWV